MPASWPTREIYHLSFTDRVLQKMNGELGSTIQTFEVNTHLLFYIFSLVPGGCTVCQELYFRNTIVLTRIRGLVGMSLSRE